MEQSKRWKTMNQYLYKDFDEFMSVAPFDRNNANINAFKIIWNMARAPATLFGENETEMEPEQEKNTDITYWMTETAAIMFKENVLPETCAINIFCIKKDCIFQEPIMYGEEKLVPVKISLFESNKLVFGEDETDMEPSQDSVLGKAIEQMNETSSRLDKLENMIQRNHAGTESIKYVVRKILTHLRLDNIYRL